LTEAQLAEVKRRLALPAAAQRTTRCRRYCGATSVPHDRPLDARSVRGTRRRPFLHRLSKSRCRREGGRADRAQRDKSGRVPARRPPQSCKWIGGMGSPRPTLTYHLHDPTADLVEIIALFHTSRDPSTKRRP
jgi:hypothetical protein